MKRLTILTTLVLFAGTFADINNCPPNLPRNKYLSTYKTSCLQIVTASKTWTDARKYCQSNHGDLVTITNFDKEVYIMSQLRSQNRHHKTWIGATDQVSEGDWKWVTDESVNGHYGNWKQGQGPTKHGFIFSGATWEDCALIDYNNFGKWNDYLCDSRLFKYQFICEYAQLTTTTSTTTSTSTQTPTTTTTTTTTPKPTTTTRRTTTKRPTTTLKTTMTPTTTMAPTTTTKTTTIPTTTTKQPTTPPTTAAATTSTTVPTSTTTTQRPKTTKMTTTTRSPTTTTTVKTTTTTTTTPATTSTKSTRTTTTVTTHTVPTSTKAAAKVKTNTPSTTRTPASPSPRVPKKQSTPGKTSTTVHKSRQNLSTAKPNPPRSHLSSKLANPGMFSKPATGSSLLGRKSGQHSKNKGSKGMKGYVIGILVGCIGSLGVVASVIFFVLKRRRAAKRALHSNHFENVLYVDEHTPPTFITQETESKPTIQSFTDSSEA